MIGTIGSINTSKKNIGDVDLVSISDSKTHLKFKEHLFKNFKENNIKIDFFATIKNKPNKESNVLLIHDLHYLDIDDLLKREWKTLINYMIGNLNILYGSNVLYNISKIKLSKEDLFKPVFNWVIIIDNYKKYTTFSEHFLKYILNDFYEYGFEAYGNKIKKIIRSDGDWKYKLNEIKNILSK